MLKTAYSAIKSVDPDSVIITGGTSPAIDSDDSITPANFVAGLYQNGAGDYFDAMTIRHTLPPTSSVRWGRHTHRTVR